MRSQFPQLIHSADKTIEKKLVYLDSAATSLKPQRVVDRISKYYSYEVSNIHRSAHRLGALGTQQYELTREKAARYLGARNKDEIVFVRGTTEAMNLLAHSLTLRYCKPGDTILVSQMEHHSNFIPWQLAAERMGLNFKVIPVLEDGTLDLTAFETLLTSDVKILSLVHVSNALGTVNPVEKLFAQARSFGAVTVLDGAQSVTHGPLNVESLGCDFLAFSGHKLFGPFGAGVLWGKSVMLKELPPFQGGGSMIQDVDLKSSSYLEAPYRFEAGTPSVGEVITMGEAFDFAQSIDWDQWRENEGRLYKMLYDGLTQFDEVSVFKPEFHANNILSFIVKGVHPSDIGALLDQQGVAIRTGHHCCQPLMKALGISGTVRVSTSIYNDKNDILFFLEAFEKAKGLLQ